MKNPTDFKKGIAIQPNPEMTRAAHLTTMESELVALYNSLDGWEEFIDGIANVFNIQRKLLIYMDIYTILGELAGECERFSLWCDARKKGEYESYMMEHEQDRESTAKYKEIKANIQGQKYRVNRDYFKGLSILWRERRESTKEAINVLKWMIRDAHEARNGN